MNITRVFFLTSLAMIAFACNSLLCRLALKDATIDAASFTSIRLVSGAVTLWLIVCVTRRSYMPTGNWWSALALFIYAAGFSFAYISLPASTGALLLFGSVQATMIGYGLWKGEHLQPLQRLGLAIALIGLAALLSPGLSAPPLLGSLLMLSAGVAWGIYSLRGRGVTSPLTITAGNFLRTIPFTLLLSVLMYSNNLVMSIGVIYAILSGALASGIGYAIWYTVLPSLKATHAATVQLSVPVIAAFGGIIFLSEPMSLRLIFTSVAILGGIALVIKAKKA